MVFFRFLNGFLWSSSWYTSGFFLDSFPEVFPLLGDDFLPTSGTDQRLLSRFVSNPVISLASASVADFVAGLSGELSGVSAGPSAGESAPLPAGGSNPPAKRSAYCPVADSLAGCLAGSLRAPRFADPPYLLSLKRTYRWFAERV